jgi:hypothetical protein
MKSMEHHLENQQLVQKQAGRRIPQISHVFLCKAEMPKRQVVHHELSIV